MAQYPKFYIRMEGTPTQMSWLWAVNRLACYAARRSEEKDFASLVPLCKTIQASDIGIIKRLGKKHGDGMLPLRVGVVITPENPGEAYIVSLDDGNPEYVGDLLHAYMQKFDVEEPIGFQWAHDATEARVNVYGGGACLVTNAGPSPMDTGMWLDQAKKRVEQRHMLDAALVAPNTANFAGG